MFYKKKGKPEAGEIVLCTVKRILYHSVFVTIDEFLRVEGMIHISEIAPGRIRNLRDYVKEGKTIVCKVLKINPRNGNIDLSLRRVGKSDMVKKLTEYKQEGKAEKLLEIIGKDLGKNLKGMYDLLGYKAKEEYGTIFEFFQDVVANGEEVIHELGVKGKESKVLYDFIKDKIKPIAIEVSVILEISSFNEKGLEDVKEILLKIEKMGVTVQYLGAPKYKLLMKGTDMKDVGGTIKKASEMAVLEIEKKGGTGTYKKNA